MKKPASIIAAVLLLILPVLYVGSYLALVIPQGKMPKSSLAASMFVSPDGIIKVSHYRILPSWSDRFFWPLEQIDRRVRPGAWGRRLIQPALESE
jgi:hypothetical protein